MPTHLFYFNQKVNVFLINARIHVEGIRKQHAEDNTWTGEWRKLRNKKLRSFVLIITNH
jgi:hypothetical protein